MFVLRFKKSSLREWSERYQVNEDVENDNFSCSTYKREGVLFKK